MFTASSARRILKRGGVGTSENLRRTKVGMNIVSLNFRPPPPPQKKKVFTQV